MFRCHNQDPLDNNGVEYFFLIKYHAFSKKNPPVKNFWIIKEFIGAKKNYIMIVGLLTSYPPTIDSLFRKFIIGVVL